MQRDWSLCLFNIITLLWTLWNITWLQTCLHKVFCYSYWNWGCFLIKTDSINTASAVILFYFSIVFRSKLAPIFKYKLVRFYYVLKLLFPLFQIITFVLIYKSWKSKNSNLVSPKSLVIYSPTSRQQSPSAKKWTTITKEDLKNYGLKSTTTDPYTNRKDKRYKN